MRAGSLLQAGRLFFLRAGHANCPDGTEGFAGAACLKLTPGGVSPCPYKVAESEIGSP